MKAILIVGSPRQNSNTEKMLRIVEKELVQLGIQTKNIFLRDLPLEMCKGCLSCAKTGKCVAEDVNELMEEIEKTDALIIGSPVYFGSVTAQVKTFLDKIGLLSEAHGNSLQGKIGGAVSVARRWGHLQTLHQIVSFFERVRMITVGSGWVSATSGNDNDISSDTEGIAQAQELGKEIGQILIRLSTGGRR